MSLTDFRCCQGGGVHDECLICPLADTIPTRREIEIEHTHRRAAAAFDELAKRALTEGAHSALAMVEAGLERGLTVKDAIEVARQGTEVWTQP